MTALSHMAAHEIARDLGCLVAARNLVRSSSFAEPPARGRASRPALVRRLIDWHRERRLRLSTARQLRKMPDHVLVDLGIDRGGIDRVARDMAGSCMRRARLRA